MKDMLIKIIYNAINHIDHNFNNFIKNKKY